MSLIRGDALTIPLADNSVDLIVTSPPYFVLRSYTDDGEHYNGQLGSEATPAAFIDALVSVTRECVRVLKPSGSLFVNLGDKYAQPGKGERNRHGSNGAVLHAEPVARNVSAVGQSYGDIKGKSLMGLPWRYALACIDQLGLILRAEIIWSKPNGLPESVQDLVRRSHEQWFHFTLEPRYFSAVDEIREGISDSTTKRWGADLSRRDNGYHPSTNDAGEGESTMGCNPLGKLPGSVWTVPTEPLRVPDDLPQHFAAFPSEWPRRIILGWSPSGICVECGEGRRPVVDAEYKRRQNDNPGTRTAVNPDNNHDPNAMRFGTAIRTTTITGESCACPTPTAPARPAVVLDPFAGTGTSVAVANHLGRFGVGIDLSADYLRLARWRCQDPGLRAKVLGVDKPTPEVPGQMALL